MKTIIKKMLATFALIGFIGVTVSAAEFPDKEANDGKFVVINKDDSWIVINSESDLKFLNIDPSTVDLIVPVERVLACARQVEAIDNMALSIYNESQENPEHLTEQLIKESVAELTRVTSLNAEDIEKRLKKGLKNLFQQKTK